MPDISTFWPPGATQADWALAGGDLASGSDLETAVIISLFTDRRAAADDVVPDGSNNRRGWWGDAGRASPIGSKLWLLEREKQTEATRLRARDYIEEALQWMVDAGLAATVTAVTSWPRAGFLAAVVTIVKPDGDAVLFNYQWAWKGL